MSLNGLDDPRVKEAHEAAVAEPGGWFLLKYATRDEVELLGRGTGGIVEIRNNIAQYLDKSPLYGFLRYRRRNVLIKYLPEDCSRLIQARVTVHFEAVCDRFSPHDTTFSIADSKELKDTTLSAACSLHAASGSTSSSTSSLRRRRLMEIAEEEEEEERERKRQSVVKEEDRPKSPTAPTPQSPVKLDADLANSPEASRFIGERDLPSFTGVPRPSSPAKSFDETGRRMSLQSARTDLYPSSSYSYSKPRVRLGARPSADLAGRPRSSAGSAAHRPVSTVPAGIKSFSKGPKKARSHSFSQDDEVLESTILEQAEDTEPTADAADAALNSGELVEPNPDSSAAQPPAISPSEVKTLVPPPTKQNTMTPEKARLLKAMKLREKKKLMSIQPAHDKPATDTPPDASTLAAQDEKDGSEATENVAAAEEAPHEGDEQLEDPVSASKEDSGVDVGTDHASVDTLTDSHPASPTGTSEIGDSTHASSVSESTDETVLAKDNEQHLSSADEENAVDSRETDAADQDEQVLPGESGSGPEPAVHDRHSMATITAAHGDSEPQEEASADAPEDKVEEKDTTSPIPAAPEVLPESQPVPSSEALVVPEESGGDSPSTETSEQLDPAAALSEAKALDATEDKLPSPQIRIPLSKFATQDTKSPISATTQDIPSIVAHTADVDSWRAGDLAPPVPEKDDVVKTGTNVEPAGSEQARRKFPDPIRTDLDAQDPDKRRSVISMLDNDGFMDELQSATVQQATPITVSKSPISPFFSIDQSSKRATIGPDGFTAPRFTRTASNPVRSSFLAPGEAPPSTARSASSGAAYLQKAAQLQNAADLRPKSAKLGSSISQRIKALEKLSGSAAPAAVDAAPKERPATTFFAVRKAGTREPSRSPSVVDRASSLTRGPTPSPPSSRQSSPETAKVMGRGRSGSLVNRLSMFEGGMPPRGRPESVQVTARIVRDPNQPFPKGPESKTGLMDYATLDLKQSPLVVDVQNSSARELAAQARQSLLERRLSKQSQDSEKDAAQREARQGADGLRPRRRSSLSFVKDFIKDRTESIIGAKSPSTDSLGNPLSAAPGSLASPAVPTSSRSPSRPTSVHQNSGSLVRRLSISSRRSSIDQNSSTLSSGGMSSSRTADGVVESDAELKSSSWSGDKKSGSSSSSPASPGQSKGSRASRFMRRISNTLTTSRKNGAPAISPTVAEENAADVEAASRGSTATGATTQSQPSIVAFMGDVNVQFPDNLLWKRRSICLDSQGFLILSAVQGTAMVAPAAAGKDRHGAMVKRYHMSDFKAPYAPDVELQELPNSVVLDLVDGSGLQIACEDRAGQMSILHILEEAHRSHNSFGH